ncbi:ferritin [Kocuria sp.]|uniref:ferritin n=1 Tax=Kocuria sp. TaxID=1871328 RepID=UPI0026DB1AB8|nr:ferritin [Kocuria sp.]MDO4919276.1 ferritin [Kocuria sp.]
MEIRGAFAQAVNDQITMELQASVVYRQLSIQMEVASLPGFAQWFRAQAQEEVTHAEKFIDHMVDRGGQPQIEDMASPRIEDTSVLGCFEAALAHERKVSESIRGLYRLAQEEGDIDAMPLLHWFISEQIEEEATVEEICDQVRLVHNDGPGLLRLDNELGAREVEAE